MHVELLGIKYSTLLKKQTKKTLKISFTFEAMERVVKKFSTYDYGFE